MLGPYVACALVLSGCGRVGSPVNVPVHDRAAGVALPSALSEGEGVVILDSDVPSRVRLNTSNERAKFIVYTNRSPAKYFVETKLVCTISPCAVVAPVGTRELLLEDLNDPFRVSRASALFAKEPSSAFHTFDRIEYNEGMYRGSEVLFFLGVVATTAGIIGLLSREESTGFFSREAGAPMTIGGGVGLGLGLLGMILYQPVLHRGTTVQYVRRTGKRAE